MRNTSHLRRAETIMHLSLNSFRVQKFRVQKVSRSRPSPVCSDVSIQGCVLRSAMRSDMQTSLPAEITPALHVIHEYGQHDVFAV